MNRLFVANIIRFLVLIPLQVLILDNINLGGHVNPNLYVYFILLLPFETSGWLLLTSSFLLGLTVDMFSGTPGIHAAASVLMAYTRPLIIRISNVKKEIEPGSWPSIREFGFRWFLTYSLVMIFIHHLALMFIEVFRFNRFFDTVQRAVLSSLLTTFLVILMQYLFMRTTSKR